MRAGIAAGRALVSSLHRISHSSQLCKSPFSSSSSTLLSKSSSIASGFRKEHDGMEFGLALSRWSQCSAPFASRVLMDGHQRSRSSFSVSGLEGAAMGCFRPRAQSHVFLQGLATHTPTQMDTQTLTRRPLDSKASSETKTSSPNPSSSPPPPPIGMGKPEEKPKTTKSGIMKRMLLGFGAVPFPALVLGIAGLIPFLALSPPLAHMLPLPSILAAGHINAQAAYAASIISFLGAIHWGLAMADYAAPGKGAVASMTLRTSRYVWSVVPSLMAWTALLLPPTTKFAVLLFSIWMVLGVDFMFARLKLVPHWFLSLRWPLTFVATVSMIPSMLSVVSWTF